MPFLAPYEYYMLNNSVGRNTFSQGFQTCS